METVPAPTYLESEEHKAEGVSSDAVHNSTVDRTLSNIELERMDYAADMMLRKAAHQPSTSNPLSNREIERLERKIDSMLADAARDPSRNTSLLNREIERLDYQIDMRGLMRCRISLRTGHSPASRVERAPHTKYYLDPDY
jgi:hypothetical protein